METGLPVNSYYERCAESWTSAGREERRARLARAAANGGHVNRCGEIIYRILETVDSEGHVITVLDPEVHRAEAIRGDETERAYCDRRGIPWQFDDGEFRVWAAAKRKEWADRVALKRGRPATSGGRSQPKAIAAGDAPARRWDMEKDQEEDPIEHD